MSYDAKVFNVMIASPSDVTNERNIAREVIHEWNSIHSSFRKIVLLPVVWETHSSPEMGAPPQDIINRQILDKCDLLIGVFWTRIGTSTRDFASGTVEEIEKHVKSDKPAMLYFSNQPVHPDFVNDDQYRKLKDFKESCKAKGLFEVYDSLSEFKEKFYRQLQLKINEYPYFHVSNPDSVTQPIIPSEFLSPPLSHTAQALLKEASFDGQGTILHLRTFGGTTIQTNGKNLITNQNPREVANWEAALNELVIADLIHDLGHKGEVFQLTDQAYKIADTIPSPRPNVRPNLADGER